MGTFAAVAAVSLQLRMHFSSDHVTAGAALLFVVQVDGNNADAGASSGGHVQVPELTSRHRFVTAKVKFLIETLYLRPGGACSFHMYLLYETAC